MSWTDDDPGWGDTDGLRAVGRAVETAARLVSSARFDVTSEAGTLTGAAWSGGGGDRWRAVAQERERGLGGLVEAAATGSVALVRYAAAVEEIAEEAALARVRQEFARDALAEVLRRQAAPSFACPGAVITPAERRLDDRRRRDARDSAHGEVRAADAAMAELADRRRAVDAVLRGELGLVEIEDWADIGRASAAAGMSSPTSIGGDATADVLSELALDVLDGNASMGDLVQLLDAWGADEEVLSRFFRTLGGSRTVVLVDALAERAYTGAISRDLARRHAEVILSAMSVASASWTPTQAQRFVEQMTDHGRWPGVVGFLFSSAANAPMGEEFTVAMADHIDEYERINQLRTLSEPDDGHVLADLLFPDRPGRGTEPMSGVLETLGRYPQAALSWLLQGGAHPDAPRIGYWVGKRDWTGDGFLGVSALWAGIQTLEGGPLDLDHEDEQAWMALALVNGAFGKALSENVSAVPERMSVDAQIDLAVALAQMMPLLVHCLLLNPGGRDYPDGVVMREIGGVSGERAIPLLNRAWLAGLFGLVSSADAGRRVLERAVNHSQQAQLDAALAGAGVGIDDALRHVAVLQAILDGSRSGSVLGVDAREAERVEARVSAAFAVISLVPVPGSGMLGRQLASIARSEVGRRFAENVGGAVESEAKRRILETMRNAVTSGSTQSAGGGAWAEGMAVASPVRVDDHEAQRRAVKDVMGVWVGMVDMSQSSLRSGSDGLVNYLNERTADFEAIFEDARGSAAFS